MRMRAWKEDDARSIDDDWSSLGVTHLQSSAFEHMEVASLFIKVRGDPAKGSGIKHSSGKGKALEEGGERVHTV
jgi:hypothetical protein